ncbi:MAG TPA: SDR family NAD(P)-dependent oxidoreductase [Myxococcota bacterium]|jgi:NAD(P)-dependent dehydrogenase (short-subunit alcohol dehydrogenase family)
MMPKNSLTSKSTADDAVGGRSLAGLRCLVTGAGSGIGVETVRALAKGGADVLLAVRTPADGERVIAGLPGVAGKLAVRAIDLSDLASVRAFAAATSETFDVVINNAGVMATPLGFTKQGFETQMGINHLAHFLLVQLLRANLSPKARVVCVASEAHRRGSVEGMLATLDTDPKYQARKYSAFGAYGDSKLANMAFVKGLTKRGTTAFALHPGVINTNLTRHMGVLATVWGLASIFMKSPAQGAATSTFAATAPGIEQYSGIYLSDCNEKTPKFNLDDALVDKVWALSERAVA